MATPSILAPGSTIADVRVESLLRQREGAMVYAAEQPALGRRVALVVSSAPSESDAGARFSAIAGALAAFEHPDVLPVYEVDRAGGVAFAVMRAPPGRSLEELIRDRSLTPARSVEIVDRIAGAVDALDAAAIGPIAPDARDIYVDGAEVHVAALEAALSSSSRQRSDANVVGLLEAMVGHEPGPLAPILEDARQPGDTREPREMIAAARAALRPPLRRRIGLVAGVGAAVAIALVVIAILAAQGGDESQPARVPRAPADAPAARLVATIPLNGIPGSTSVGSGAVWVATLEGNVLRVDPRTNHVLGAPIRFAPRDLHNNVTVRAGAGALFVLDGNRGRMMRIDPASGRVMLRRTLGGVLSGAAVDHGIVWVLHWYMRKRRPVDELVRLDARTLRPVGRPLPIGRPVRIGPQAADVEARGGVAWVTNSVDGTVMRFDGSTNISTTIRGGGKPTDSALVGETLWAPDVWGGALTPIEARTMRLPEASLHFDYPFSAAAADGTLWVVAQTGYTGPGGPSRLYRVDPRSRAIVGRPVDVGSDVGWIVAGAGAVWVRSTQKRTLLKFVATSPTPALARARAAEAEPPRIAAGPLRRGPWATRDFAVPFTFSLGDGDWLVVSDHPEAVTLAPVDDPLASVTVYAPRQAFTPSGSLRRLRTPGQAIALLMANPQLRVSRRHRTSLGGVPATALDVRVRRYRSFPPFCQSPCVVLYGLPADSAGVEADKRARLWFLTHAGRTVVVAAEVDARRPDFTRVEGLLRTVRFR